MVDRHNILLHTAACLNSRSDGGRVPQKGKTLEQKLNDWLCYPRNLRAAGAVDVY
ncbi:MAG: hypothetical protein ACRKGH_07870 [Dehalogenimonas sp.]